MFARVTLVELDIVRMSPADALEHFRQHTLPALRQQAGYEGAEVFATSEGKGMIVTFWQSEADAEAGLASGFYDEQIAQFLLVLRQPPGREYYELLLRDAVSTATV
jgi:heme-degrading monooxygenase HmoA